MRDYQIGWYLAGPALGLCVVACRWLFNARLGVTGGFSELVSRISAGSLRFDWRGWFAIGVLGGGALFGLLHGGSTFDGYGWLTRTFSGGQQILIVPLLLLAGGLVGYGAKVAGGCTSGNGLSGTSALSPAGLASTATFFATAIVVTVIVEALI